MCSGLVKFSEVYGRMAARYGGNCMIYCNVYEWMERLKGVLTGECDAHSVWPAIRFEGKGTDLYSSGLSFAALGAGEMNVKRSGREKSRTT